MAVRPVKARVIVTLSFGMSDAKGLADLMEVNINNLRAYLSYWEESGVVRRTNPGSRPVLYDLTDKGKEELALLGRRR